MRRPPIRIRTFMLATLLVLLVVPSLAGAAAWLIERDHEQARVQGQLNAAFAYLALHRASMGQPASVKGLASLLDRFGLLGQLVIAGPRTKGQLYISPALAQPQNRQNVKTPESSPGPGPSWADDHRVIPVEADEPEADLVADLYYRPASRATAALAGLVTGVVVLVAGLAAALWLAGRWMVTPLTRLSAEVDKVAGGDLTITVPRSRIGEVENIAQAVGGMTAALGETAQRRAEADEARRFLVTSIAHDLRTPLFALRGHLQAIGAGLGDPVVHLQRAEARADALERLIGNLFAYTRDDYAQPAPHLEAMPVAGLLDEVTAGLDHAARLRDNSFDLRGDRAVVAVVDRDRAKRALTNILDNALRYSPPGAAVHLGLAAEDSVVQITVQDDGPGIAPNLLPHIFEPGIRGAAAAGAEDVGAGLGLTIAKRLLEHQHATLGADNAPEGGARITVTLQRAASPR
jgi:signal transduction histidine kinase